MSAAWMAKIRKLRGKGKNRKYRKRSKRSSSKLRRNKIKKIVK